MSKVALLMWLEGNREALRAYLMGDRSSELVAGYFARCGVPSPRLAELETRHEAHRFFSSEKDHYRN